MKILPLILLGCLVVIPALPDTKLTPAELVTKHLQSIGSVQARARVKGTKIKGSAIVTVKLCGEGQVDGNVLISSQGRMNLIDTNFNTAGYPYEFFRFDSVAQKTKP